MRVRSGYGVYSQHQRNHNLRPALLAALIAYARNGKFNSGDKVLLLHTGGFSIGYDYNGILGQKGVNVLANQTH